MTEKKHWREKLDEAWFFFEIFILMGPFGILVGLLTGEWKPVAWGFGTLMLWIGLFGLLATINWPTPERPAWTDSLVNSGRDAAAFAERNVVAMAEAADSWGQSMQPLAENPVTYLVVLLVGLTVVAIGTRRMMAMEEEAET